MKTSDLQSQYLSEEKLTHRPRPYVNHSISFKTACDAKERCKILDKIGLNVFQFPAKLITGVDMLSDSGTTTMTDRQWAALHEGDESYGSNRGFFALMETMQSLFGKGFFNDPAVKTPNAFIFHQGRPGEHALFSVIARQGTNMIIPSNGHFDTTRANIESNAIEAVDLFSDKLKNGNDGDLFKGNMDVKRLVALLKKRGKDIPLIYLTITNNTGGGQPVSLANIKAVAKVAKRFNKPFFFDACRFAENAYFIKKREVGYAKKPIKKIIKEMFSYIDGFTISFKKDGLVNMGGGIFIKDASMKTFPMLKAVASQLIDHQILTEGHPTYGGMSGRDIMALVRGLKTITCDQYLKARIEQVRRFGEAMKAKGVPVLTPVGGHAVYLDLNKFFKGTKLAKKDFGGISFTALLLGLYGHRACELGDFAFGTFDPKTKKETFPEVSYVRFAIPRLRYEEQDLMSVVDAVAELYKNRKKIPAINVSYGKALPLRHFKARFKFRA